jgi:hypothetical protein
MLFGSVGITIKQRRLIIKKLLFRIPFYQNSYFIDRIENPVRHVNTKANTYWSIGSGNTGNYSPKEFRIHDIDPTMLYFDYNNKRQKIGEGLNKFEADLIIKIISELKSAKATHNKNCG